MTGTAERTAGEIARRIDDGCGPSGSLCVFGDWFGRPGDNWHRAVAAHAEDDCLSVEFAGGETLRVWAPGGVDVSGTGMRIDTGERVRWEWYSYGHDHLPENRVVREHRVEDGQVRASSTAPGYRPPADLSSSRPAVELA